MHTVMCYEFLFAIYNYYNSPAGVTIQMREDTVQVPEGYSVTVCADLTGRLERDVVVQLATTTLEGFRGAGVYSFGEDIFIPWEHTCDTVCSYVPSVTITNFYATEYFLFRKIACKFARNWTLIVNRFYYIH